ncbi:putative protein isoform X2 [Capsicum annuum]
MESRNGLKTDFWCNPITIGRMLQLLGAKDTKWELSLGEERNGFSVQGSRGKGAIRIEHTPVAWRLEQILLSKDLAKLSAYRDRRFPGTQEEFEDALLRSIAVYMGNMSFYTTEEQVYELFSRAGEIKKIVMGLDKNSKTPCGFCFVMDELNFLSVSNFFHFVLLTFNMIVSSPVMVHLLQSTTPETMLKTLVKYISGTILDDPPISVDFDGDFKKVGNGAVVGVVRMNRTDYDPDILFFYR